METVDILIAVFAVIAVVGSVAGAALYEPPEGGIEWQVAFSDSEEESLQSQGGREAVTAGATGATPAFQLEHNVSAVGITALKFDVTLSSDRVAPRTGAVSYEAYLVAPDGTELRDDGAGDEGSFGTSDSFTLTVPDDYLIEVPEDRTVQGQTTSDVRDEMNTTVLQSNATGVWVVHIHLTFPQGGAIVAENVQAESTPKLKRVLTEVGTDLDIFTGA